MLPLMMNTGLFLSGITWSLIAAAAGQAPPSGATSTAARSGVQGVVTADDVYVRSGDSTNHYTVCKLGAGSLVTIVSERGDWYEILPPTDTFSLISGDYVDTADGKTGVVNGDNVRVRAGSSLNDNKYTVQTMLNRGAAVKIIERNPDGFLRIEPPAGATVWIHRSYVKPSGTPPAAATESPRSAATAGAAPGSQLLAAPAAAASSSPTPTRTSTARSLATTGQWNSQLTEIDEAAKTELAKPADERRFEEILDRYRKIAAQNEDEYAKLYAGARIEEIGSMVALADAIGRVRGLGDNAETQRREFLERRANLPGPTEPVPRGIQVQGELRISALYPPGSSITRYRLIDPRAERDRTIAYVEIPGNSAIEVERFIGRHVGVLAYERRMHGASIDPVPIYIATELVLLAPPTAEAKPNP